MAKRIALCALLVVAAIIVIMMAILFVWSPGKIVPIVGVDGKPLSGSISEKVKVSIGGIEQGMFLRGENAENPVLLFLHGGPGSPEYMMEKERPTGLEKFFTVCWWDQRGAGMSFDASISGDSLTLPVMISDTIDVTNYLRERFKKQKIYLMGHSWGSFLGMHVIKERPELYEAYVGIGQVVNQMQSEKLAYDYMLETARDSGDKAMAQELEKFTLNGPSDLNMAYLNVRSASMNKLGIGLTHEKMSMFGDFIMPVLRMPEYTLGEKIGYVRGTELSLTAPIWTAVSTENLMETVKQVGVPVYIIQGKYDYQVSYALAKEYSELIQAPAVSFYTFEHSAHCPNFEEPELFMKVIREDVLGRRE